MNKLRYLLLAPLLAVATQAGATMISGGAYISSINVSTTGTASFRFADTGVFESDTYVNDFSPLFESDFHSDVVPGTAHNKVDTGSSFSEAEAYAGPLASATVSSDSGNAFASSYTYLDFQIDGIGDINLSIDLGLYADIEDATGTEYVDVSVLAYDSLFGYAELFGFVDSSLGDDSFSDATTLSLSYTAGGRSTGALSFETFALAETGVAPTPASVPEAPAAALFLTALLGMGVMRRRQG